MWFPGFGVPDEDSSGPPHRAPPVLHRRKRLDYPGYPRNGHRTTANFYVTLLHLAGASRDSFGMADPVLKEFDQHDPLSELLS